MKEETLILLKQVQVLKDLADKIASGIDVNNLDEIRLSLRKELSAVTKSLKGIKTVDVKFPDKVKVDIDNATEIERLLSLLTTKDYSPVINVVSPDVNVPEIVLPKINVPKIDAPNVEVNIDVDKVVKALDSLKYLSDRADKPLSVRISDGKKFMKALQKMTDATEKQVYAFSQSSGLSQDEFKNTVRAGDDILNSYRVCDKDNDASPNYYGFTNKDGEWYILKETVSPGADTYRYVRGNSAYTTAWTNRATLTYGYFHDIF